jgi:6-phosphogluconolactonase
MAVLKIADTESALAELAAQRFEAAVAVALQERSVSYAMVSLTGGSTPRRLYELLARDPWRARIPWAQIHLFWGDERNVPPDHPESNYGMARDALIAHVPIPAGQVHRMHGELPAAEAASQYARELEAAFAGARREDRRFDVMLLGLGEDAHIASIFPGSPVLLERDRRVSATWAEHLNAHRITLTPPALLDSHRITMLVAGARKAGAVKAALEGAEDVERYPAQLLRRANDRVEWIIDRAAARALSARRA